VRPQSSSPLAEDRLKQFAAEHSETVSLLKTLLIFILVWPLIWGLIVGSSWMLSWHIRFGSTWDGGKFIHQVSSVILLFYLVGLLPVIVLGVVVSTLQTKYRSFGLLHVVSMGLLAGIMLTFFHSDKDPYYDLAEKWMDGAARIVGALVATLLCWSILRVWRTG
jgi:hypothetical protein